MATSHSDSYVYPSTHMQLGFLKVRLRTGAYRLILWSPIDKRLRKDGLARETKTVVRST